MECLGCNDLAGSGAVHVGVILLYGTAVLDVHDNVNVGALWEDPVPHASQPCYTYLELVSIIC